MTRARLAILGLFLVGALSSPASAQGVPDATQTRAEILQLVSQSSVVEPDSDLTLRLHVTGAPAGARIHVEVHSRVPTRSDFKAALAGRVTRARVGPAIEVPATPDASGIVVATVPTRDPQSLLPPDADHVRIGEGVYPVTVDLLSSSGTLDSLVTFLIRLPVSRQFGPLGVAIVLPEGGTPALQPDGSSTLDSSVAQSVLGHASVLQAHSGIPLTVVPTGETVDALAKSSADELHKAVAGRQLPVAPYVRLRPSEWLSAGLGTELDREFDQGTATVRDTLGPPDPSTYIADDRLTDDAARALVQRGVHSLIVPEDGVSKVDERLFNRTLTQPFDLNGVSGLRVAAADAALSAHAGETGDPVLDANHLLADLAVLYFDDPPDKRAAVVAF
ncbi:MAG TPA: hypothetical protein VGZ52_09635, partial [Acidimicrobiales bacterium]|nr:hypothetical protein [Acidimicrobiales bacterium]